MQESAEQLENPAVSAESAKKTTQFKVVSKEDLVKLEEHRQSVATKRNTKWGINLFAGTWTKIIKCGKEMEDFFFPLNNN